ncbi:PREDICTED: uncharacterized protein LOC109180773 [Ipomoea nil]|uniref:uncharacterized protein LOC109180773 n=1 Tax=Ipomoea nil TaxID=35883 RepID=UPI000901D022|nr:PREDICTED: uncharacterized protein LOC109180773 [Ipomoea nil]
MKIFNWVHHKFSHKDGIFRHPCAKKNEVMIINSNETNADRKALLENALFGDRELFNDETWEMGILAIGTMGFDQMNEKHHLGDGEEFEDEEEDFEEYYSDNNGDSDDGITTTYEEEEDEEKEELNPLMFNAAIFSCDDNQMVSLGVSDSGNKKRERITLADLFSADTNSSSGGQQDVILVKSSAAGDHATAKPPPLPASSLPTKTGLSFAKKIIPKLVGDRRPRRPINQLHQLMTRMLRRKIHPEMEGKKSQTKPTSLTTK